MPIEVGTIIEGVVTGITNFGAFVRLGEGKTGLVHISEVADDYVKNINDYLKENDKVSVKILSIDKDGKISLSIKQAKKVKKSTRPVDIDWNDDKSRISSASFEDRLSKFLKESDERQQQLKKSQETKRGGGYSKKGDNNGN